MGSTVQLPESGEDTNHVSTVITCTSLSQCGMLTFTNYKLQQIVICLVISKEGAI